MPPRHKLVQRRFGLFVGFGRRFNQLHNVLVLLHLAYHHWILFARPVDALVSFVVLVQGDNYVALTFGDHFPELERRVGQRVLGDDELAVSQLVALYFRGVYVRRAVERRESHSIFVVANHLEVSVAVAILVAHSFARLTIGRKGVRKLVEFNMQSCLVCFICVQEAVRVDGRKFFQEAKVGKNASWLDVGKAIQTIFV